MPNMCVNAGVWVEATAKSNGKSFKSNDKVRVNSVKLNGLISLLAITELLLKTLEAPLSKYSDKRCDLT